MSPTRQQEKPDYVELTRRNLALIATIITCIFSYAQQTYKINNLEDQVKELKDQKVSVENNINDLKQDMVYIKTTLDYIKKNI